MTAIPPVSVVIAAYQAERFITAAVRSVLDQSFRTLELLVVDDGSTDRTAELARQAIGADPRGRVLWQENRGEGGAKNVGIRETAADLIAVVDGDDVCHPEKLEHQVAFMHAHPQVAACFTHMSPIDEHGAALRWPLGEAWFNRRIRDRSALLAELFSAHNVLCHPTVLLRRTAVEQVGLYTENIFAPDLDLWLRLLRQHDIAVLPRRLLFYRVHQQSQTFQWVGSRRAINLARSILRALQEYSLEDVYPLLRGLPPGPEAGRERAQAHLDLASQLERSELLELLPMALQHRLWARALAPDLVPLGSLQKVAERRATLLARELAEQPPDPLDSTVGPELLALRERVRELSQAMVEHERHPIHRLGRALGRLAGRR